MILTIPNIHTKKYNLMTLFDEYKSSPEQFEAMVRLIDI